MALQWKTVLLQAIQKAVFLMSSAMLVYQVFLSIAEYQKNEYIQVPEDSTLSKMDMPMLIICHEQPFKSNLTSYYYPGVNESYHFIGWARDNMTTQESLESLATVKEETHLQIYSAFYSEGLLPTNSSEALKLQKLRKT